MRQVEFLKRVVEVSILSRESKFPDFWLKDPKWETRERTREIRERGTLEPTPQSGL